MLKAKDTVIKDTKKIQDLFYYSFGFPMVDKLLEAQAEISFKMGYNQALKDIKAGLMPSDMV